MKLRKDLQHTMKEEHMKLRKDLLHAMTIKQQQTAGSDAAA